MKKGEKKIKAHPNRSARWAGSAAVAPKGISDFKIADLKMVEEESGLRVVFSLGVRAASPGSA